MVDPREPWEISERAILASAKDLKRNIEIYLAYRYSPDPAARWRADAAKDSILASAGDISDLVIADHARVCKERAQEEACRV